MTVTENGMAHYTEGDELSFATWARAQADIDVEDIVIGGNVVQACHIHPATIPEVVGGLALNTAVEAEDLLGERGVLAVPLDHLGIEAA